MARPKPPAAGKGRKKGVPNKFTASLKEAIQAAANGAHPQGMVGYLTDQADKNPTAFMALLGRTLPKEITGGDGKPLFPTRIEVVGVRAKPNDKA